ncbi:MAG: TetR/AcrR family transcriptional regulator [Oscillospiraceae bacterium]|nr:TetR/AcrR family transcriptional regulator [Oscillospiraceae bacterium]
MPPKSRITRPMILDAAVAVVREEGIRALNVRSVATRLKCSTQPVMYHFDTMTDLRNAVYAIVSEDHKNYILNVEFDKDPNPCLTVTRNYIRYAAEHPLLFQFLFQTNRYKDTSIVDLLSGEQLAPILRAIAQTVHLTPEEAREAYAACFIGIHGLASLLANNSMEYDPNYCEKLIGHIFQGVVGSMKQNED